MSYTKKSRLNLNQQQFAKVALQPGETPTSAVMKVYGGRQDTARQRANDLLSKPYIVQHIAELAAQAYPDLTADALKVIKDAMQDPEASHVIKLQAVDRIAKYLGWEAPKQSRVIKATVDMNKFKLPGEDK